MQFSLIEEPWAICICSSSESPACKPQSEPEKPEQPVLMQTFLWDGCNKLLPCTVDRLTVSGLVPCLENLFHCSFTALPKQRGQWQHRPQDAIPTLNPKGEFGVMPPPRSGHGKEVGADS